MMIYVCIVKNHNKLGYHQPPQIKKQPPRIVTTFFLLVMNTFKMYSPSTFQIHDTVVLTTVAMLYMTSPQPIYHNMEVSTL